MRRLPATVIALALMGALVPSAAEAAPDRVPLARFKPLPAAAKVHPSAAARALRRKLLGQHALDPDYVTLDWVGV